MTPNVTLVRAGTSRPSTCTARPWARTQLHRQNVCTVICSGATSLACSTRRCSTTRTSPLPGTSTCAVVPRSSHTVHRTQNRVSTPSPSRNTPPSTVLTETPAATSWDTAGRLRTSAVTTATASSRTAIHRCTAATCVTVIVPTPFHVGTVPGAGTGDDG